MSIAFMSAHLPEVLETISGRIVAARNAANDALLHERGGGVWVGELSTSALSTATAILALATFERHSPSPNPRRQQLIRGGLEWLGAHQNPDGGWGDTVLSLSNISTTALGWAAFGSVEWGDSTFASAVRRAEAWLRKAAGGELRERLPAAIADRYGRDRTFSVPILMACVLGNRFEPGSGGWHRVLPLPFELAALPNKLWGAIKLPVVSYALPALIAIGQGREHHAPTRNPATSLLRRLARRRTLGTLARLQPENGGFLEAVPLTSFVSMSLASMKLMDNITLKRGLEFIEKSVRPDGSWPIDTNLSTWVSTLAVNALPALDGSDSALLKRWLLDQQTRAPHPYTNAAPGAWGWTPLPGGVPDADDTASALLALRKLGEPDAETIAAAQRGVEWLLDLQNRDGGIPTFCRGWGALPFDQSAPDLTAHAMRAWRSWQPLLDAQMQQRIRTANARGAAYLARSQNEDGSWTPLWFGNERASNDENRTYGTTRALLVLAGDEPPLAGSVAGRALTWLIAAQNNDGSWSGFPQGPASVEETALAVEALAAFPGDRSLDAALSKGAEWLATQVESGRWRQPSPIGFYFAKLWYYERLYPMIYTVAALNRVCARHDK